MTLTHVEMMRTLVELASSLEAASRTREATALRQAKVFIETVNIDNRPAAEVRVDVTRLTDFQARLTSVLNGDKAFDTDPVLIRRVFEVKEDFRAASRELATYRGEDD